MPIRSLARISRLFGPSHIAKANIPRIFFKQSRPHASYERSSTSVSELDWKLYLCFNSCFHSL